MKRTPMSHVKSFVVKLLLTIPIIVMLGSCSDPDVFSEFTDVRDNKTYRVMSANGLRWFAEDLNLNNNNLYSFQQALGACPEGWSLPTIEDWVNLSNDFGGYIYDGQSMGDPVKAYKAMIKDFGAAAEARYWTSTPAWSDAPSIRSSHFYFNSYNTSVEYGATLVSFRFGCRCVSRKAPDSGSDVIEFTINGQRETYDNYRIDHENGEGSLAAFLHGELLDDATVNRVNIRFDLPLAFVNGTDPEVEASNVYFEQQITGIDPWQSLGHMADPEKFEVLITYYDNLRIKGTFSGTAYDGTAIEDGTFDLSVTHL